MPDEARRIDTNTAESGAVEAGELGQLPVWDLSDLYAGIDAPEVGADMDRAASLSAAFQARFKGKLAELVGSEEGGRLVAEAIAEYERIEEIMGKLGSFAGLVYSADTSDPARAKFYGDVQDRLTTISTDLLFFTLELNRLDDVAVESALLHPALARYRPWLEDLRLEHSPGAQIGFAEISVLPEAEQHLTEQLEARGWTISGSTT